MKQHKEMKLYPTLQLSMLPIKMKQNIPVGVSVTGVLLQLKGI